MRADDPHPLFVSICDRLNLMDGVQEVSYRVQCMTQVPVPSRQTAGLVHMKLDTSN